MKQKMTVQTFVEITKLNQVLYNNENNEETIDRNENKNYPPKCKNKETYSLFLYFRGRIFTDVFYFTLQVSHKRHTTLCMRLLGKY